MIDVRQITWFVDFLFSIKYSLNVDKVNTLTAVKPDYLHHSIIC